MNEYIIELLTGNENLGYLTPPTTDPEIYKHILEWVQAEPQLAPSDRTHDVTNIWV